MTRAESKIMVEKVCGRIPDIDNSLTFTKLLYDVMSVTAQLQGICTILCNEHFDFKRPEEFFDGEATAADAKKLLKHYCQRVVEILDR